MIIDILASGSSGNVAVVHAANKTFLIDCGKPFNWINDRLNYELPDAILITHEHCDHAKSVRQFLYRNVDIFATYGTIDALDLDGAINAWEISAWDVFYIDDVKIIPIPSKHDAAEPVNFILEDRTDRVLFATDTGEIPPVDGIFTKIFLEANYSTDALLKSDLNPFAQARIFENHLSFEDACKFLSHYPDADITLLHISQRHGDKDTFYSLLERSF